MNQEGLRECWGHYGAVPVAQKCARSYCQKTLGCHVNLNEATEQRFSAASVLTLNGRSVLHPNWEIQTDTFLTCVVLVMLLCLNRLAIGKVSKCPSLKAKQLLARTLQTNKQNQPWQKQTTRERRTIQQWTAERLAKVPALVHRMYFLVCFLWSVFIGWVLFWVVSYSATEGVIFG